MQISLVHFNASVLCIIILIIQNYRERIRSLKNSLTKEHKNPSLTIVVPVYNEEDALRIFLPNLTNICRINRWKIIIVNDGSIDQTASVLSLYKELPNLKIITHLSCND
jgi:cellulose synthase/poly-beta-1,6-N-acetylglucosamine synthase-like glycosyltransferase